MDITPVIDGKEHGQLNGCWDCTGIYRDPGCPKIGGTFFGVPMREIIVCWVYFEVPICLWKLLCRDLSAQAWNEPLEIGGAFGDVGRIVLNLCWLENPESTAKIVCWQSFMSDSDI